jgi:hypothetical protein
MHAQPPAYDGSDTALAADAASPDMLYVEAQNFRALRRNTLRGFLDVFVPTLGITIRGVSLHQRDGRWWASAPGRARVGQDGVQRRDSGGQLQFVPVFEFLDRAAQDRFSEAVLAALHVSRPDVLAEQAADEEPGDVAASEVPDAEASTTRPRRGARRRRRAA